MSSRVRIEDASPRIPAIDISLDGKPYVRDLYFGDDSGYVDTPAGDHELAAYRSGTYWPLVGPTASTFEDGESYTVIIQGLTSDKQGLHIKVLRDEPMPMPKAA